ncbi:MAG TPA: hypothetical protein VGJ73_00035 [Verrucomicrobiae bacterium]
MNSNREEQIGKLFTAELQFRLASAVRVAVMQGNQPLDLPIKWIHGKHSVAYEEIALRQDQADYAACFLHRSATYLMAVVIKDAIRAIFSNPKTSKNLNVQNTYQIARLIRNAFAHDPTRPMWSIDPDCRNKTFSVSDIISLDTSGINGTEFDWRHYGGPLALFRLCRFVRFEILKEKSTPRKSVPAPKRIFYQQGNLILEKVSKLPPGTKVVKVSSRNKIHLGNGHFLGNIG